MQTAKIFKNGNSQAVRLPKEFQFDTKEVEILKRGDELILRKPRNSLKEAFNILAEMPDDFYAEPRLDPPPGAKRGVLMPPRYLLDTNICIYIAKRRPLEVLHRFEELAIGEIAMSIITYGELRFGAEKSRDSGLAQEKLARLAELVPVLPLPEEAAIHYGRIRSALERAGTPIGANDLWIAAHALAEELILVTNNTGEFSRVPEIRLENWVIKQSDKTA